MLHPQFGPRRAVRGVPTPFEEHLINFVVDHSPVFSSTLNTMISFWSHVELYILGLKHTPQSHNGAIPSPRRLLLGCFASLLSPTHVATGCNILAACPARKLIIETAEAAGSSPVATMVKATMAGAFAEQEKENAVRILRSLVSCGWAASPEACGDCTEESVEKWAPIFAEVAGFEKGQSTT